MLNKNGPSHRSFILVLNFPITDDQLLRINGKILILLKVVSGIQLHGIFDLARQKMLTQLHYEAILNMCVLDFY